MSSIYICIQRLDGTVYTRCYMDELFAVLSITVFVFELKKNQFKLKIQKCTWGGMLGSF